MACSEMILFRLFVVFAKGQTSTVLLSILAAALDFQHLPIPICLFRLVQELEATQPHV